MKLIVTTLLKLAWGSFLLVTSLYCLLAFLPYTYHAFIHAPPYLWMLWFVKYHVLLYWAAVVCAAIGFLPEEMSATYLVLIGGQVAAGVYFIFRPFIATIRNDRSALLWALAALVPVVAMCLWEISGFLGAMRRENLRDFQYKYSPLVYAAVITAVVYFLAAKIQLLAAHKAFSVPDSELVVVTWSVVSLLFVGVMTVSVLNVIGVIAVRMPRPRAARVVLLSLGAAALLRFVLLRFCAQALSFEGPAAQAYSATVAVAIVLFSLSLLLPFIAVQRDIAGESTIMYVRRPLHLWSYIFATVLCAAALALPTIMNGRDWNGFLQSVFAILFWVMLTGCVYSVRRKRANYSLLMVAAIAGAAIVGLKALQATEIFWARPIGKTDDDIARAMETYGLQDASFGLTNKLLGKQFGEPCGDLCRIMREYTNIPDAKAEVDVNLVDTLTPAQGEKPNIFIFVIDSLRPDYLGAYNAKVAFTPNIDALAHDPSSVALKNVYTQYAGTALSEPAIWSGALLLHAHWMQPFSRVNSLEKLARIDGYKMLVSKDTVLSQILDPTDDLINLDPDKKVWNQFEACSTVQSAMREIDSGSTQGKPIFFYAQPMNVHQFAQNNQPRGEASAWHAPVELGFNSRIATEVHQVDGCLGTFFDYLRKKGMWDSSIIIITSDHGDATGELGRVSHSTAIYPEVMHVPMIVHLSAKQRANLVYDDSQVSSLIDVAPTLYYLLGHKDRYSLCPEDDHQGGITGNCKSWTGPLVANKLFGHPIFQTSADRGYYGPGKELFLASDVRAVYGILDENGRYLYATYDAPAHSELFDLHSDPTAQHNIVTAEKKREYDVRIIQHLQDVANFYKYQPKSAGFWTP